MSNKNENPLADLKNLVAGAEPDDTEDDIEIDEEQMTLLLDNIALMGDGDLFIMQQIILHANTLICEQIRDTFINGGEEEETK